MRLKPSYLNTFSIFLLSVLLNYNAVTSDLIITNNNPSNTRPLYILTILKALFGDGFVNDEEMARKIKEQSNLKDSNITDCYEEILNVYTDCCKDINQNICQTVNGTSVCVCKNLLPHGPGMTTTTRSIDYYKQDKKEVSTSLIILSIGN